MESTSTIDQGAYDESLTDTTLQANVIQYLFRLKLMVGPSPKDYFDTQETVEEGIRFVPGLLQWHNEVSNFIFPVKPATPKALMNYIFDILNHTTEEAL